MIYAIGLITVFVVAAAAFGFLVEVWLITARHRLKWTKRYCWRLGPLAFRVWTDSIDDIAEVSKFTLTDGSKWRLLYWRFYRRSAKPVTTPAASSAAASEGGNANAI